ncbi:hypothetical protein SAMN05428939_7854 [Streptomyces sp. TLI_105]|nr:hypothetical protein SAMN05428939_7854 [Streptomyces sp. TLI_105]
MIQPVVTMVSRDILAHQLFTGISRQHLACLAKELADPWEAVVEGRRRGARGGARKREAGPVPGIGWGSPAGWSSR